jgi:zinc resistance-associated protein
MKKVLVGVAIVLAVALVGTLAYAARPGNGPTAQVDINAFKQFQKQTLPLRDEMMTKGMELRNEFSKDNPDKGQIDRLKGEMKDLRTRIQAAAEQNGLPAWGMGRGGRGGSCGYDGPGKRGGRMMGNGFGRGWQD